MKTDHHGLHVAQSLRLVLDADTPLIRAVSAMFNASRNAPISGFAPVRGVHYGRPPVAPVVHVTVNLRPDEEATQAVLDAGDGLPGVMH